MLQLSTMSRSGSFIATLLLLLMGFSTQAQDVKKGEEVFKALCNSCHIMGRNATGPNLYGVEERWAGKEELLYTWIKNPQTAIEKGDPYIESLLEEWEPKSGIMAAQNVSDEQITDILAYVNAHEEEAKQAAQAPPPTTTGDEGGMKSDDLSLLLMIVSAILVLVLIVLITVKTTLTKLHKARSESDEEKEPTLIDQILADIKYFLTKQMNPTILVLTIGGIVTLPVLVIVFINVQDLGSQMGYAPDQPIKFSHKLHAGTYQIDCQYCHTGVEKSKNANIPSANICMNCHVNIQQGPKYGKEEIAKIYAAIGFDPEQNEYSGETKPIEWVRIHNLPDHVNFNHQQHVVAGNLDCENCHGKIAEMEVVQQVSLLEMGWCINCHRETEVQIDNNYYQEHFHDVFEDDYAQFKESNPGTEVGLQEFVKEHKRYTIADLGGLECQRCHY